MFTVTLKENPRGRFLRITEEGGTKRASVIVPSTGLAEFKKVLDEMVAAADAPSGATESEPAPVMAETAPEPVAVVTPEPVESEPAAKPAKRSLSEAARAKLSAAAKARWAKIKGLAGDDK